MVISAEFLGLLLLVTSAAALGLSIVMDVGRVSAEKARETMMQRQHEKKKAALTEWKRKTEQTRGELTGLQARHTEFTGRRHKALTEIKALEFAKVELVHELGDSDETTGFWAQLNVQDNVATIERRDVIFSRQIWEYRNVAHVFAPAPDQATALLRTAFTAKNGVLPSQIVPLSMAPDIGAGIGSKALSA
ncbi:hypothetical protein [Azospirillum soli]|uniref:hypothetical protein n=1 Tax=Azospirillum soli TaxID=1304799 RepID=UPI001AE56BB7|nr:hypothetical protein [Azospirillum soli]MBP2311243.1 hypothetical protein [Azospirillum soli]